MQPKFYYYGVHKNLDPTLSTFNTDHCSLKIDFLSPPNKSFKWSPAVMFSENFYAINIS